MSRFLEHIEVSSLEDDESFSDELPPQIVKEEPDMVILVCWLASAYVAMSTSATCVDGDLQTRLTFFAHSSLRLAEGVLSYNA